MKSPLRKHLCPSVDDNLLCPDLSFPSLHSEPREFQFSSEPDSRAVDGKHTLEFNLSLAWQIFCLNVFISLETSWNGLDLIKHLCFGVQVRQPPLVCPGFCLRLLQERSCSDAAQRWV